MDKDKNLIYKSCLDCGKQFYVTNGHSRRKKPNYHWRCHDCMKLYRSTIQKSSKTNIGNLIKDKISNPEISDQYRKSLSDRAKIQWSLKSDEEKQKTLDSMVTGSKNYFSNLSESERSIRAERLRSYYQTRSNEEALRHKGLLSNAKREYFNNMTDEDKETYREIYRLMWENKSDEEKALASQRTIDQWKNMSDEDRTHHIEQYIIFQNTRWQNANNDERLAHGIKISEGITKIPIEEREKTRKLHQQRWMNMDAETKYQLLHKTFSGSGGKNKLHETFEKTFCHSYLFREYLFREEIVTENDGLNKSWDYGIYDRDSDTLQMVVDLDGSYFHADNCDYDGLHSKEEYDERRFLSVPDQIKIHIIYEEKFKQSFESMIKILKLDYHTFIDEKIRECRNIEFPYPKYTTEELMKSWNQLIRLDPKSVYMKSSTNTRVGDRIISHFHPSIYHASVGKNPSPYDAWHDDKLLRKVIENRIIYMNELNPNKILQGFNVCKIAPKVSVFSAGRAKILINKYLNDMNEIFDPFSGFGGRMLGAISLGKKYIGQDISDNHVYENQKILEFLKSELAILGCSDILQSSGEYQCLFTCPPYGNKETWHYVNPINTKCDDWIDECLLRFKCKRYMFIVDTTDKYKDHIVDEIINKSHFGSNSEYVIIIERN